MKRYVFTTSDDFRRVQLIEEQLNANVGTIRVTFAAYDRSDAFKTSKKYKVVYTMTFDFDDDAPTIPFEVMRSALKSDVFNALTNNQNVEVDVLSF